MLVSADSSSHPINRCVFVEKDTPHGILSDEDHEMSNMPDDILSRFLDQAQRAINQTNGVNAQSLRYITNLAAQMGLSREEMDAAGAQLGLSNAEVRQVMDEAGLEGEGGSGGGALRWVLVLGSLAMILGIGG